MDTWTKRAVMTLAFLSGLFFSPSAEAWCQKQTTLQGLAGRFPGNNGPDLVVRVDLGESVQNAIDTATDLNGDGYIIIGAVKGNGTPYGQTSQRIVVDRVYPLPFGLFGCSLTLRDPNPADGLPTAHITATAAAPDFFVMDLHANGSPVVGWLVEGNGRFLRNAYAKENAVGYWFIGDNNTLRNSSVERNHGVGIMISGNGNTISNTKVAANGGHGIESVGDHTRLVKNTVGERDQGNGEDGIHVSGAGTLVEENKVYANFDDGIAVSGGSAASPNVVRKNTVGDKNKGNTGNGIVVSADSGNGGPNPIELESNLIRASGRNGILITTTAGYELKNNLSGGSSFLDNLGCEFLVETGNLNATGNKANEVTVAGKDGDPFPSGCLGTP